MDKDWAEKIARGCSWDLGISDSVSDPKNRDFIEADISKIADALRKVHRDTIESCAVIAENETKWFKEKDGSISLATATLIASAIRESEGKV